jgi:DNA-binding protein YbaB
MRIYVVLELINGPGDLRVRVVAVDEGLVEADAQLVLHMALVDVGQDAHHRLQQEDQQQRENVLQQMTTPNSKIYITCL